MGMTSGFVTARKPLVESSLDAKDGIDFLVTCNAYIDQSLKSRRPNTQKTAPVDDLMGAVQPKSSF